MKILFINILSLLILSCGDQTKNDSAQTDKINVQPVKVEAQNGLERAYFASGCFWCVEAIYESIEGVEEVISGYSGGHTQNPTYESSNTGKTGHAEAVEVIYDPKVVDFKTLVEVYFGSQDPTQVNGQGPDLGSQYRSLIFYQTEEQKRIIEEVKAQVAKNYDDPIAAEVLPFQKFWEAEKYHQNYERNNPQNPYIKKVSIPRLNRFKERFPDILKKENH